MKTEKSKKKIYSINNNKYDIDFNKTPKPLKWGIYIIFVFILDI